MPGAEDVAARREDILRLAARRGVRNVRLFGSIARGEQTAESDVDLLVDLDAGRSLLDLGSVALDLEDLLGVPVHLVTVPSLHWYIRDRVLEEAVPL